jgi:hypothetical protein
MSTRRNAWDWVWLVGESNRLKAEIQPERDRSPCMLRCGDADCDEWATLWTEPDPLHNGQRHVLCHISECQMFDEKQKVTK